MSSIYSTLNLIFCGQPVERDEEQSGVLLLAALDNNPRRSVLDMLQLLHKDAVQQRVAL